MRGTVKFFNAVKGWGFIRPAWSEGNSPDVFFHRSAIERRPGELWAYVLDGEPVEFELGQDRRGRPCAVKVRRSQAGAGGRPAA
jgi:cold shock CspA family protein